MRDVSPMSRIVRDLERMARGPGVNVDADGILSVMKKCVHVPSYFRLGDLQYEKADARVRRLLCADITALVAPRLTDSILFDQIALVGFNIKQDEKLAAEDLTERLKLFTECRGGLPSLRTVNRAWLEVKSQLAQKIYHDLNRQGLIN